MEKKKPRTYEKKSPINDSAFVEAVTDWREQAYCRFFHVKKISAREHSDFLIGTKRFIRAGLRNGSLRVLEINGNSVAVIARRNAPHPRMKGQQEIVFHFKPNSLASIQTPMKLELGKVARQAPKFTEIGISPENEKLLATTLTKAGFTTRYEILVGNTLKALDRLVRTKKPPKDLKHLGFELRALKAESDLRKALRLQKYVATKAKSHSYFAYTPAQLRKDKKEYSALIKEDRGLVLGVFKDSILLGLMIVGVHSGKGPRQHGGFSFFLHDSIQGMGITKTGYRLMLEYLKKKGINTFYGGTSQPAIQAMGKVMGRSIQHVIYLKL